MPPCWIPPPAGNEHGLWAVHLRSLFGAIEVIVRSGEDDLDAGEAEVVVAMAAAAAAAAQRPPRLLMAALGVRKVILNINLV